MSLLDPKPTKEGDPLIEPFFAAFDRRTGVLVVRGELDQATAPQIHAIDLQGQTLRSIDCSETTFISAAGVTALLESCGSVPTTVTASPVVRRVIELCGLDHVLVVDEHGPTAN